MNRRDFLSFLSIQGGGFHVARRAQAEPAGQQPTETAMLPPVTGRLEIHQEGEHRVSAVAEHNDELLLAGDGLGGSFKSWFGKVIDGEVSFQRDHSGDSDSQSRFWSIAPLDAGGYLVGGEIESRGAALWKVTDDGRIRWRKQYGDHNDEFHSLVRIESETILVGGLHSPALENNQFWLLAMDTSGEIKWERTYPKYAPGGSAVAIAVNPDNSAVVGNAESGKDAGALLLHVDTDGEPLAVFPRPEYEHVGLTSVCRVPDGYVAVGQVKREKQGYTAWILQTDENLRKQWSRQIGTGMYASGIDVFSRDEGLVVICQGRPPDGDSDYWGPWGVALDHSGTVVETNTYDELARPEDAIKTADGGYVVVGESKNDNTAAFKLGGEPWPSQSESSLPNWLLPAGAATAGGVALGVGYRYWDRIQTD